MGLSKLKDPRVAQIVVIVLIRERKRLRLAKSQEILEEKIQQPAE